MNSKLPEHAKEFFKNYPLHDASWHPLTLAGLMFDGISALDRALLLTTDLDVDTDGPGGSKENDQYWQAETSLRWPDNSSVDSRQFPGFVIPPALRQFGARMGDFGFSFWKGATASFQIYDFGPATKAGEGSVYLARALGIVPSSASDHKAAAFGNSATDVVSVIFPGSAPGTGEKIANHAVSPRLIHKIVQNLLRQANLPVNFP